MSSRLSERSDLQLFLVGVPEAEGSIWYVQATHTL